MTLAEAVVAEAKKREDGSKAKAFETLRDRVLTDQADGVAINAFYFQEAKWRRPAKIEKASKRMLSPADILDQQEAEINAR
jgi:hypothetical protein